MLAIAVFAAALAADGGPARADVLLHDGGVDKDSDAARRVEARTGQAPALILNAEVLSGPTRMLAGNVSLERCEGATISVDAQAKLAEVGDLVLAFQLEEALAALDVLSTLFPCSEQPIPAGALPAMNFLRGAALLDLGNEDAASASMRDALAIQPDYKGEVGFPAPHGALLEAQRQAPAVARDPAPLAVWLGRSDGQVFVDGLERAEASRDGVPLIPGRHLVQIVTERGTTGLWVRTEGAPSVVVLPGAGRRIWADGGRSPGGEPAMRLLLAEEFGGTRGDIHVLHYRGRKLRGASFPADGGPRVPWEGGAAAEGSEGSAATSKPKSRRGPGRAKAPAAPDSESRVRFAVGGGYQYAMPFHFGMLAVDVSVRPIGPLIIGAFARPSLAPVTAAESGAEGDGLAIFVPFGGGAGVQKPGAIAPYVMVGGQVAINRDGAEEAPVLGGVVVQGGIDLSPPNLPLLLRVQGEVGNLNLHLVARGWVGVGARF